MDIVARVAVLLAIAAGFFLTGYVYGHASVAQKTVAPSFDFHKDVFEVDQLQGEYFIKSSDLNRLDELVNDASKWPATRTVTVDTLPQRQQSVDELGRIAYKVLDMSTLSLTDDKYEKAREAINLVKASMKLMHTRLRNFLPEMSGRGKPKQGSDGELIVKVEERPFGLHLQRTNTRVKEVFPGFPAARAGIHPGCEILEIAGKSASSGKWLEAFQKTGLPFEIRLNCTITKAPDGQVKGPLSQDPQRYRVMVVKKPFGMNIQVNVVPRVVEVLPGFPAEAAGVHKGFVLTEVQNQKVDSKNWFHAFQTTKLPFTLTFDTTIPVRSNNTFFPKGLQDAGSTAAGTASGATPALPYPSDAAFEDFRCEVNVLPFAMQIRAPPKEWPRVEGVVLKGPADIAGVRKSDVLVEVAGRPVESSTWFAAFQQASPPFGLKFRRPRGALASAPKAR